MKKKILLAVLSVLALCACDGSGTSSSSSTPSESSNSVVETKDWTTEQKKTMSDHLYGEVLPYIDVGEANVYYDSTYQFLSISGSTTVTVNQTELKAYANLLTSKGFYDSSSQYTYVSSNDYTFQKIIETKEGKRVIDVEFYATTDLEELPLADSGTFYLEASDFRMYKFPSEMFDAAIKQKTDSNEHVPPFEADWYVLNEETNELYCYTSNTDALTTYKTALQNNHFTVLDDADGRGAYLAISQDKKFAVTFRYVSPSLTGVPNVGVLGISIGSVPALPQAEWPEEGLKAAFTKYSFTSFDVPKFTSESSTLTYLGYEDENNQDYLVSGVKEDMNYTIEVHGATQQDVTNYESALVIEENGWTLDQITTDKINDGSKFYSKKIDDKVATIDVSLGSKFAIIHVYLYMSEDLPKEWPTDKVEETMAKWQNADLIDETIPALSNNDKIKGYKFYDVRQGLNEHPYVEMLCSSNDVQTVFEAYVSLLTTSGWTTGSDNEYLSPSKVLSVKVEKGNSSVKVEFYEAPLTSWPTGLVAKANEKHSFTDELPALDDKNKNLSYEITNNVSYYGPDTNSYLIKVTSNNSETTAASLLSEYETTLTNKGFTSKAGGDSNDKYFDSPSKQYVVEIWYSSWSADNCMYIQVTKASQ